MPQNSLRASNSNFLMTLFYFSQYIVRLYDGVRERWRLITIDDYIPCHKNSKRPIFAKPHGFITVHYFFVLIVCCRKRIMGRIIGEGICKNAWRVTTILLAHSTSFNSFEFLDMISWTEDPFLQ